MLTPTDYFVPPNYSCPTRNPLINALQSKDSLTENGCLTNSTAGSALVDFLAIAGSARNMDDEAVIRIWTQAFAESKLAAIRLLFYIRDIRGGQGERKTFRTILTWLGNFEVDFAKTIISLIPEYGRWDDLMAFEKTSVESHVWVFWALAIQTGDRLACKWAPRENSAHPYTANRLRSYLGLDARSYRKLLSANTHVVESTMCDRKWDEIEFSHVPSCAMRNYKKAFERNCSTWSSYLEALKIGTRKVNASVLYPYQVVKDADALIYSIGADRTLVESQWKSLPDYIGDSKESFIPVVDTSGSMSCAAGKTGSTCLDVAISLGLYCAERNKSVFKDAFITFSKTPKFQYVKGGLVDKLTNLDQGGWNMNTDIEAVFKLILDKAVSYKVSQCDMPTTILILSDMEFDNCAEGTALDMIKFRYKDAGYILPRIVFWNLNAHEGNSPVTIRDTNTALVSGFSPSIMKYLLGGKLDILTPWNMMMEIVNSPRYSTINI